eukprot:TRINITY_DN24119_c0_g1_i1.p1 TRINITY_DN24119_c0_g1~~TRINITY_DN24119_c0_g1_i1.p1  ORF type:complete len:699 (+),score=188.32 TRINITY_DN24119_c0_g1_i1:132-2228(+)
MSVLSPPQQPVKPRPPATTQRVRPKRHRPSSQVGSLPRPSSQGTTATVPTPSPKLQGTADACRTQENSEQREAAAGAVPEEVVGAVEVPADARVDVPEEEAADDHALIADVLKRVAQLEELVSRDVRSKQDHNQQQHDPSPRRSRAAEDGELRSRLAAAERERSRQGSRLKDMHGALVKAQEEIGELRAALAKVTAERDDLLLHHHHTHRHPAEQPTPEPGDVPEQQPERHVEQHWRCSRCGYGRNTTGADRCLFCGAVSTASPRRFREAYFGMLAERCGDLPGVRVRRVSDGGPAHDAGLRPGDFILSLGGSQLRGGSTLQRVLTRVPAGKPVSVVYQRGSKRPRVVEVTPVPRGTPASRAAAHHQHHHVQQPQPPARPPPTRPHRSHRSHDAQVQQRTSEFGGRFTSEQELMGGSADVRRQSGQASEGADAHADDVLSGRPQQPPAAAALRARDAQWLGEEERLEREWEADREHRYRSQITRERSWETAEMRAAAAADAVLPQTPRGWFGGRVGRSESQRADLKRTDDDARPPTLDLPPHAAGAGPGEEAPAEEVGGPGHGVHAEPVLRQASEEGAVQRREGPDEQERPPAATPEEAERPPRQQPADGPEEAEGTDAAAPTAAVPEDPGGAGHSLPRRRTDGGDETPPQLAEERPADGGAPGPVEAVSGAGSEQLGEARRRGSGEDVSVDRLSNAG